MWEEGRIVSRDFRYFVNEDVTTKLVNSIKRSSDASTAFLANKIKSGVGETSKIFTATRDFHMVSHSSYSLMPVKCLIKEGPGLYHLVAKWYLSGYQRKSWFLNQHSLPDHLAASRGQSSTKLVSSFAFLPSLYLTLLNSTVKLKMSVS